jgi:hypothetical protein
MDGHTMAWAQTAVPVLIHLKDLAQFPHQKQYPLRLKVKERLIPIITDLKGHGQLIECSSPCSTLILRVKKRPKKWKLVQNLHLINGAVVLLHPVVPNPYIFKPKYHQVLLTTLPWT